MTRHVLALFWVSLAAGELRAAPRIAQVEIRCNEVFETPDGKGFWLYRVANKLHILTREEQVQQELLFSVGDPLDPEALSQTERNLRAFPYLRDARITTSPAGNDAVNVRVETWDSWSTQLEVGIASAGDTFLWSAGVSEKNLLGRGKQFEASLRSELDRDSGTFYYRDGRFLGSRVATALIYSDRSDGRLADLGVGRPFFSLSTTWAAGFRLGGFDQLDPLYAAGEKVDELRHVRRLAGADFARAIARRETSAVRLHFGYRRQEDEVQGDLRRFGSVETGLTLRRHRFLKLTHVNSFELPDDFNLGDEAAAFVGLSTPATGGEPGRVLFFFLEERKGLSLGPQQFFLGRAAWRARHRHGRLEQSVATFEIDYYNKLAPRSLIAASVQLLYGTNLDPEVQITMGAEGGLRGYPVRRFTGNRSLLMTAEKRFFFADDVGRLVSLALAGFFDAGYAWPEGQSLSLGDLRTDVGVGLLIGTRLASRRVLRLDLARALRPLPGRSPWLFSVGSRVRL